MEDVQSEISSNESFTSLLDSTGEEQADQEEPMEVDEDSTEGQQQVKMPTQVDLLYLKLQHSKLKWLGNNAAGTLILRGWSTPPRSMTHWALKFQRGASVWLVDGIRETDGSLSFTCRWRNAKQMKALEPIIVDSVRYAEIKIGSRVDLGRHEWTDIKVQRALRDLSDAGMYHPLTNNCQTASVRLARRLSIPIPEQVLTIQDCVTKFGDSASASIQACALCTTDVLTKLSS
ncbi:hypothetical protein HPB52_013130 [Rhipicephalus sanguineus]|uniref:Uncharacterized protein n=1 Tax=Rhipicephalus sanguineus TaxID=34632 RepID=A0A9D4PKF6_RHISA|nr:hypothetical protein HPB52_013130 [Rhipicephalus sanguineus]